MKQVSAVTFRGMQNMVQVEISTALSVKEVEMICLQDKSGAFRLNMPRVMLPFGQVGETVLVAFSILQAEVKETSPILRAG